MGGGDLNLKKSWHPSTLRNIERVWKAEQKHEVEKQKIEQLQKELAEERAREEIQAFAEDQGVVKKRSERLDWMYQGPTALVDREEYLLGRKIDKTLELLDQSESGTEPRKDELDFGFSSQDLSGTTTVDLANKIREDPLFSIMKKEKEQRKNLLCNPVKMKQLQQVLQASLGKDKKKKSKKHGKKHHKKDRSYRSPDDERPTKSSSKSSSAEDKYQRKSSSLSSSSSSSSKYHERHHHKSSSSKHSSRNENYSSNQSFNRKSHYNETDSRNKRQLDVEERERRLKEMQENAKWREEQRLRNVKRYREEVRREEKQAYKVDGADFIRPMLSKAARDGSLENRVKQKLFSIQRSTADMDKHFARR